jgi:misacylated tRNA(Ala) deacylase
MGCSTGLLMHAAAPTTRLYLDDDHALQAAATVVAERDNALAFDRTCFYPGGGGQPHDLGTLSIDGEEPLEVTSVEADEQGILWHVTAAAPPTGMVGKRVALSVDAARRLALTRYHTVLHVLNTIALKDYDGWITGAQIGTDYSRIDFKLDGFSPALCQPLQEKVNAALREDHRVTSHYMPEDEFRRRDDLLRTLEVKPPVHRGQVRIVEIEGFDAQACGGTHVRSTGEVGALTIFRTENKGRINKRLYVRLEPVVFVPSGFRG